MIYQFFTITIYAKVNMCALRTANGNNFKKCLDFHLYFKSL